MGFTQISLRLRRMISKFLCKFHILQHTLLYVTELLRLNLPYISSMIKKIGILSNVYKMQVVVILRVGLLIKDNCNTLCRRMIIHFCWGFISLTQKGLYDAVVL